MDQRFGLSSGPSPTKKRNLCPAAGCFRLNRDVIITLIILVIVFESYELYDNVIKTMAQVNLL